MSLVRKSKFRHVYGCAAKKEECYEGLKIMRNVQDGNVCAVNPRFLAVIVESAGGGVFAVLPIDKVSPPVTLIPHDSSSIELTACCAALL